MIFLSTLNCNLYLLKLCLHKVQIHLRYVHACRRKAKKDGFLSSDMIERWRANRQERNTFSEMKQALAQPNPNSITTSTPPRLPGCYFQRQGNSDAAGNSEHLSET